MSTPPTERYLTLDGGLVRVLAAGEGEGLPLLLIHGGGYDNAGISWREVLGPLSRSRRVLAPDLSGFGRTSGLPVTGDADEMADLVAAVAHAAHVERAVVVGLSMGGEVALRLALRRPDLVAGLVLVAPGGLVEVIKNPATQLVAWLAAQLPDPLLFGLSSLAGRFADRYLGQLVHDPATVPAGVREAFLAEARRSGAGLGYGRYNQRSIGPRRMRNTLLPDLHRITSPTLILHGRRDRLVDPAGSRAAVAALPEAELVLVEDCGHWLPVERPELFVREVERFVDRIERPG